MQLSDSFFASSALEVAPALLGAIVTVRSADGAVSAKLTEVEAYQGAQDPASHAYRGRNRRNASMFAEPGTLYVYRHMGLHDCVNLVCQPAGDPAAVLLRAGTIEAGLSLAAARRGVELPVTGPARAAAIAKLASGPARLAQCLGWSLADDGAHITVVGEAAEPGGIGAEPGPRGTGGSQPRSTIRFLPAVGPGVPENADLPDWLCPAGPADWQAASHGSPLAERMMHGPRVGVRGPGADPDRFAWRFYLADEASVSIYRAPPELPAIRTNVPSGEDRVR